MLKKLGCIVGTCLEIELGYLKSDLEYAIVTAGGVYVSQIYFHGGEGGMCYLSGKFQKL